MFNDFRKVRKKPLIKGAGLVVLDIILNNGYSAPIFKAGGTCGNVLAGLSYLGWNSSAIARIGTDFAGKLMIKDLSDSGVNVSYLGCEEKIKTPRIIEKLNLIGTQPKHTFLLRCPTCNSYLPRFHSPTLDAIEPVLSDQITPAVFFFDRVSPAILKLAKKYRDNGALIFFEPNNLNKLKDNENAISLCHVVKYSGDETKDRSPSIDDLLLEKINPLLIIKTLGKEGLMFRQSIHKRWHYQRGIAVHNLKDTCGAGDWCTTGFLYQLNELSTFQDISHKEILNSYNLTRHSLRYAQIVSALSCSFIGARGLSDNVDSLTVMKIINNFIKDNPELNTVICSISEKRVILNKKENKNTNAAICPICLLG